MKTELLAPAGDIEAAYAALHFGADALYLGLKSFSARATATNFDEQELDEITAYAHHLKRKVYVTLNTLIKQNEQQKLIENLDVCSRCKVDAIILQDLGVAYLIKKMYPNLEMHASTQMAVHNKEGALFLKSLGFSRVVLARELTLNEINDIASIEGLETEVFIHGALCYSYSGICQFSALEYDKSANRGKCLYPCRALFESGGQCRHFFSMKDLALEEDILKIKATSLKIEGRKKSALYVAAVTNFYRKILDGAQPKQKYAEDIKQIFSRPWCKFHFFGKNKNVIDRDFVGHRGLLIGKIENITKGRICFVPSHNVSRFDGLQIDVQGSEKPFGFSVQSLYQKGKSVIKANAGQHLEIALPNRYPILKKGMNVYLASASEVKGAYPYFKPKPKAFQNKFSVDVTVEISEEKLCAKSFDTTFELLGYFEKAQNKSAVYDAFEKSFQKTGDLPFALAKFSLKNPKGLFAPASIINDLRRGLYAKIQKTSTKESLAQPCAYSVYQNTHTDWIIKTDDLKNLKLLNLSNFAEIIYLIGENPDFETLAMLPKDKVRIALPTLCRSPKKLLPAVQKLLALDYHKWEASNPWALEVIDSKKYDLAFGPFLYMFNTSALLMAQEICAKRITFSIEDSFENISSLIALSPIATSLVVYQDVPLFTSAVCIKNTDCNHCTGVKEWLTFKKDGHIFETLSEPCQTMLFDKFPLSIVKGAVRLKPSFYQMDFCFKPYTPESVKSIADKLMHFEDVTPSTQGNFNPTKQQMPLK